MRLNEYNDIVIWLKQFRNCLSRVDFFILIILYLETRLEVLGNDFNRDDNGSKNYLNGSAFKIRPSGSIVTYYDCQSACYSINDILS